MLDRTGAGRPMSALSTPRSDGAGADELVVLLDEGGRPCGTAPKSSVHHAETPLHLAFSCWLFDPAGRVLLTQRAAGKRTWPLIWTNSFCGHPAPGEDPLAAVQRRGEQELGLRIEGLRVVLPDFRYTARMDNGVTENEVCPVHVGTVTGDPAPDPAEVAATAWWEWPDLVAEVAARPSTYSPWLLLQLPQLVPLVGEQERR